MARKSYFGDTPWHELPYNSGLRDAQEYEGDIAARGKRNASEVTKVSAGIREVKLFIRRGRKAAWIKLRKDMKSEHIVHAHTVEFAERWARLMQVEMAAGESLESVAASTAYRANLTLNGQNYISNYQSGEVGSGFNAVMLLKTGWRYGNQLNRIVSSRPDIVRNMNLAPTILAA